VSKADHPRLVLVTTILASSLSFIDGSVVNVGLPAIGKDLQGSAAELQWVINAYLLPLSALLLLGGAAGDRFGRVRVLVVGIGLFAVASAICTVAPSLYVLLAGRALQGVGAALLLPNSLAILGGHFSGEARGRAVGTWAAVGAMAAAVGPVLGGWLIDQVGWRSIFIINLPVAVAAAGMAVAFVREPKGTAKPMPLDIPGAVLATVGLGALVWGLTVGSGPSGWNTEAIGTLVAGIVLSAAFLVVEHRRGDRAMTPLALFGSKSFAGLTLFTLLLYGAFGGLMVLLPFVLIESEGYKATAAGAALLPLPLALAVLSPIMGGLAGKLGSRLPLSLGTLIVAAGFLLMMRVGSGGSYWTTVLPALLVASLGMAGAVAPLTTAVLASVDARHTGVASGLNSAVARTGGLVATALLGGVLAASGAALIAGFRTASVVCAVTCVAASLSAFLLLPKHAPTKREGRA
jgi:EmrB/QacA subfamily drug resistance transporter